MSLSLSLILSLSLLYLCLSGGLCLFLVSLRLCSLPPRVAVAAFLASFRAFAELHLPTRNPTSTRVSDFFLCICELWQLLRYGSVVYMLSSVRTHVNLLTWAGNLNDFYRLNPTSVTWTPISASGSLPCPRNSMGLTATPNGAIYVFGGNSGTLSKGNSEGQGRGWVCRRQQERMNNMGRGYGV